MESVFHHRDVLARANFPIMMLVAMFQFASSDALHAFNSIYETICMRHYLNLSPRARTFSHPSIQVRWR